MAAFQFGGSRRHTAPFGRPGRLSGFATLAVGILGIGIASNAIMFSVMDPAPWQPLPFPESERLFSVSIHLPLEDRTPDPSLEQLRVWPERATRTVDAEVGDQGRCKLLELADGTVHEIQTKPVSEGFFALFVSAASQGRTLVADDYRSDAPLVAVVSHAFWRRAVLRVVTRETAGLATIGIVIGVLVSLVLTRTLESMFLGVSPLDPVVFVTVSVLFATVVAVAAYVPARRADRVDPAITLMGGLKSSRPKARHGGRDAQNSLAGVLTSFVLDNAGRGNRGELLVGAVDPPPVDYQ